MTRGKYGAAAHVRRHIEDLENRLAGALLAEARAQEERDRLSELLTASRAHWQDQQRALIADRDAVTSPRIRQLAEQVANLNVRLSYEGSLKDAFLRDHSRLVDWFYRHLRTEHGMREADSWDLMAEHMELAPKGGVFAGGVGVVGLYAEPLSAYAKESETDKVETIQRARGIRK